MKKKQKSSLKNRALSQTAVLIIVTMWLLFFIWSFIQGHLMNGESTKKKIW